MGKVFDVKRKLLAGAFLVLGGSACASLVEDPYDDFLVMNHVDSPSLSQSLARLETLKSIYFIEAAEHGRVRNGARSSALLASFFAVANSATDGSDNASLVAGLLGGTALATTEVVAPPVRTRILLEGRNALNCARDAMAPLRQVGSPSQLYTQTISMRNQIRDDVSKLDQTYQQDVARARIASQLTRDTLTARISSLSDLREAATDALKRQYDEDRIALGERLAQLGNGDPENESLAASKSELEMQLALLDPALQRAVRAVDNRLSIERTKIDSELSKIDGDLQTEKLQIYNSYLADRVSLLTQLEQFEFALDGADPNSTNEVYRLRIRIAREVNELEQKLSGIDRVIADNATDAMMAELEGPVGQRLERVRAKLIDAENTISRARSFEQKLNTAGDTLWTTVDKIHVAINLRLHSVDISSDQLIDGFNERVLAFGTTLTGQPSLFLFDEETPDSQAATTDDAIADLGDLVGAAELQTEKVALTAMRLHDRISAIDVDAAFANLQACTLIAATGQSEHIILAVPPKLINYAVEADRSTEFDIEGGNPPYSATWAGRPPEGLRLEVEDTGQGTFTVTVDAEFNGKNEYTILVKDADQRIAVVRGIAQGRPPATEETVEDTTETDDTLSNSSTSHKPFVSPKGATPCVISATDDGTSGAANVRAFQVHLCEHFQQLDSEFERALERTGKKSFLVDGVWGERTEALILHLVGDSDTLADTLGAQDQLVPEDDRTDLMNRVLRYVLGVATLDLAPDADDSPPDEEPQ